MDEVTSRAIMFPNGSVLASLLKFLAMNSALFQALDPDLEAALVSDTGLALSLSFGALTDLGSVVTPVTGADLSAWQALVDTVTAQLLQTLGVGARRSRTRWGRRRPDTKRFPILTSRPDRQMCRNTGL